jgi:hypothetical protein
MNPLPLGMCAAVDLRVWWNGAPSPPYDPMGGPVVMAHFDLSVNGGTSVAGHRIDQMHYEVCGCQGGEAGSKATVTATYPTKEWALKTRMWPGVSFQQSVTFALASPNGTANPPACDSLK